MTAAHCMDGLSVLQYDVMAGEHNIHLPDLHEEMRLVKKAIMHPNYTWNDKEFDIGLVQVASPFKFTDYIQVGFFSKYFRHVFLQKLKFSIYSQSC